MTRTNRRADYNIPVSVSTWTFFFSDHNTTYIEQLEDLFLFRRRHLDVASFAESSSDRKTTRLARQTASVTPITSTSALASTARNLSPPTSTERHASAESRHPTKSELSSRDCATCRGYNLKASAVTRYHQETTLTIVRKDKPFLQGGIREFLFDMRHRGANLVGYGRTPLTSRFPHTLLDLRQLLLK